LTVGLLGILLGLALLIVLAFRGWSVLLLAPIAALAAAAFSAEPLLASWTQTFMSNAADFVARFFPLFLLGALFGKLMDDSGSVTSIAQFMTEKLGPMRAMLAVVFAGALVTYGGVSLFVAFFVLAPMAQALFRASNIPRRLMPAAIALGTSTFTMSAMPGTPAIPERDPDAILQHHTVRRARPRHHASVIMLGFGLWRLKRVETAARSAGEGFGRDDPVPIEAAANDPVIRERATTVREFDPAEISHGDAAERGPPFPLAALPLIVVVAANLTMSFLILPRLDLSYLAEERWGAASLSAVGGVWSVIAAINYRRLPGLRGTMDAGANASVLPIFSVASLVGFGAVVASLPAFAIVRDWVLSIHWKK
jgi:H+/gluconate symporter-like permease